jgi:histone deacetylase complex regulatory component SIN3
VVKRISCLFNGHPSIIQGFNAFLPPRYHITPNQQSYLHQVEDYFKNEPHVYKAFLEIMTEIVNETSVFFPSELASFLGRADTSH